MATSAFKSTTKRTPIGTKLNSDDSSSAKAHRRSRSLSRFSHRLPEPELDFRDVPAPRGKFVNTTRGSGFPEISLDDLAIEFFPLKTSLGDERESDRGRLSRRSSEVSPANAQTPASQRRGRSVSRQNARASDGKSGVYNKSSDANLRRRRSVSVARYQISDSEVKI